MPVDLPSPGRAVRIGVVQALPAYLSRHPDMWLPRWVRAGVTLDPDRQPDPAARIEQVQRFAHAHGVQVDEGPHHVWAVVPFGSYATHGIDVDYVVQTAKANPIMLAPTVPGPRPPARRA